MCEECRPCERSGLGVERQLLRKETTDTQFALALVLPIVLFLIGMVLYPLAYSLWLSVHNVDLRLGLERSSFVGLLQYAKVLQDTRVPHAFLVSIEFSVLAVTVSTLLGLGMALILNETFRGRTWLRLITLLPWAVSEYVTAVLFRLLFNDQFGFINSILYSAGLTKSYIDFFADPTALPVVAIAFSWHLAPLGAFFLLASLQVVPEDLYRAAKVDGMSSFGRFRHVSLPFLRNALLITIVLCSLFSFTALDIIIMMTGGGPGDVTTTVTYLIFKELFVNLHPDYASALSYFLLICMMVFATIYFILLTKRRGR